MPKKKKTARDMTTEEIAKRVFPKKVIEEIERVAHESDERAEKREERKKK